MKLPTFLKFLAPLFKERQLRDAQHIQGWLRVTSSRRGSPEEILYDGPNFIVDLGLTSARDVLIGGPTGGRPGWSGSIFRMAIGDGGCPAGQLFTPKLPDASWPARTGLYHEVLRQDIATFTAPTATSMCFVGAFHSTIVDPSSFSLVDQVINEAALIIGDGVLVGGGDPKQINKVPPDTVGADEKMFSTRCFKSSPFAPTDTVIITVTWTINVIR